MARVSKMLERGLRLKEGPPWEGYYWSTDGGASWASRLIPGFPRDTSSAGQASPLQQFDGCIDPSLAFDRSGNVYFAGSCGKVTASGAPAFGTLGVFVAKYSQVTEPFISERSSSNRATRSAALPSSKLPQPRIQVA